MIFQPPNPCHLALDHLQQQYPGDCLAACTAMSLSYLGVRYRYRRLIKRLGIDTDHGAPFSNILKLNMRGVSVIHHEHGTWNDLYQLLRNGWPVIVSVQTRELRHWQQISSLHVVVLVGMEGEHVYIHDPALATGPIAVSMGDFDLAWLERNEAFAVVYR